MSDSFWLKQSIKHPLFEDLLWSRPEHKSRAGKLLIAGGSSHGFSDPALAYTLANEAGAGRINVLLPNSLKASVGSHLEDAVFAPSNATGSFSRTSLADFIDQANWADLTLLAGDFGHNSETAIVLESFLADYKGELCLTNDSADHFFATPSTLFERPNTFIVLEVSKLQKLLSKLKLSKAILSTTNLTQTIDFMKELTDKYPVGLVISNDPFYILGNKGQVAATEIGTVPKNWTLVIASYLSVWWMQNKDQPFKAAATGIYESIS
jgi:hypothetical protein